MENNISKMIGEIAGCYLIACLKDDPKETQELVAKAEDIGSDLLRVIKEEVHRDLNRSDW